MLREMSGRGNVQLEECPVGEIIAWANGCSGKCQLGEMSVGELSSRGCVSREVSVGENVQSGKCPNPVIKISGIPSSLSLVFSLFNSASNNKLKINKDFRILWSSILISGCLLLIVTDINLCFLCFRKICFVLRNII